MMLPTDKPSRTEIATAKVADSNLVRATGAQALLLAAWLGLLAVYLLLRVAQKSMRRSRQENLDIRLSMICSSRRVRGQRKISPYITQMTSSVIRVPNATSVKKCPPKAMRD